MIQIHRPGEGKGELQGAALARTACRQETGCVYIVVISISRTRLVAGWKWSEYVLWAAGELVCCLCRLDPWPQGSTLRGYPQDRCLASIKIATGLIAAVAIIRTREQRNARVV